MPAGADKTYKGVPKPPGQLPVLGDLLAVFKFTGKPQMHLPVLEWSRSLGPVYL